MAGTQEVIATLAREARLQQLSSIEGLDTEAASLIGFARVVLGLLFTAPAATNHWNVAALDEGWATAPVEDVYGAVTESITDAIALNNESLQFKALYVRFGVALLVLGLLLATAGVLYFVTDPSGLARV